MASRFCAQCGKPVATDSQFCASCGAQLPAAGLAAPATTSPAPPNASVSSPVAAAAPPAPAQAPAPAAPAETMGTLGSALGVEGTRAFHLQHQLLSGGRNYRVLNHEKRHLFTVTENVREELMANFLRRATPPPSGLQFGVVGPVTRSYAWVVADASGSPRASISIQMTGNSTVSTLADANGNPLFGVQVERGMMGGLTATAQYSDGSGSLTAHGNLLRHNFLLKDASGGEAAKIHEAWASVRDTYNLDLVGAGEPLGPLLLAILIDREKEAESGK
jgi:uncharacterized protein YxjI